VPLSDNELLKVLLAQLDEHELLGGVAYYATSPLLAGAKVSVPRVEITAPWDALLGFVDREPAANWGHSCRYVLINRDTGEALSIEGRFPPFAGDARRGWRVAHKAESVPDALLAVPTRKE
jgi:hypothetical protein